MQKSLVTAPLAGLIKTIGFPASVQVLLATEKIPRAAMSRSTLLPGTERPAVVGSTTIMSSPVAAGAASVRVITASPIFGASTASDTMFDWLSIKILQLNA